MIPAFPKIWALGAPDISNIFNGPVEVTEKVDGSQIGFGRTNTGEFVIRSKGTEIYRDTVGFLRQPDGLFKDAVAYLLTIKDKVSTDTHYYGEVIAKQKHNTLTYGRVPDNSVILYAKRTPEGFVSNRIELLGAASALDLEVVPVLLNGTVNSSSELNSLLDTDSFLGGCKIEGVVVKNYAHSSNIPYSTYCFGK